MLDAVPCWARLLCGAKRPAVHASETRDSPRTCPVHLSAWGAVPRFFRAPRLRVPAGPRGTWSASSVGQREPAFSLALFGVACGSFVGKWINDHRNNTSPTRGLIFQGIVERKRCKKKQLEPGRPVNRERGTRTFPASAFRAPNISRVKRGCSRDTARRVPQEPRTHGEVVLKVPAVGAGLLGGGAACHCVGRD